MKIAFLNDLRAFFNYNYFENIAMNSGSSRICCIQSFAEQQGLREGGYQEPEMFA